MTVEFTWEHSIKNTHNKEDVCCRITARVVNDEIEWELEICASPDAIECLKKDIIAETVVVD